MVLLLSEVPLGPDGEPVYAGVSAVADNAELYQAITDRRRVNHLEGSARMLGMADLCSGRENISKCKSVVFQICVST